MLIETRRAADLLGATKMDRPEDVEANPKQPQGLRHADQQRRGARPTRSTPPIPRRQPLRPHRRDDAAGGDHAATRFTWEILVKCGDPSIAAVGATFSSATSKDGWFGMPDNCAVDSQGRCGSPPTATGQGTGRRRPVGAGDRGRAARHLEALLPLPGRGRDVRPVLHARRRDAVRRRAAPPVYVAVSGTGSSQQSPPSCSYAAGGDLSLF